MKISKFVEALEKIKGKYGDIEVVAVHQIDNTKLICNGHPLITKINNGESTVVFVESEDIPF